MTKDSINTDQQPVARWHIDMDWYQQRSRSISTLLQGSLCDTCRKKLSKESKQPSDAELLNSIRNCCNNNAEFITSQTPILESIFRFFLATGNKPVTIAELGKQLSERRRDNIFHTPEEILLRLLQNDRYYGFRPVAD